MNSTMKRIAIILVAALALAGCGDPPISERVKNREECEAEDGFYYETHDFGFQWWCDLDSTEETP